jgi:hypothetical protein
MKFGQYIKVPIYCPNSDSIQGFKKSLLEIVELDYILAFDLYYYMGQAMKPETVKYVFEGIDLEQPLTVSERVSVWQGYEDDCYPLRYQNEYPEDTEYSLGEV